MSQEVGPMLLPIKSAAKLAGIGYASMLRAAHTGKLPSIKVGRCIKVSREALKLFVARLEAGEIVLDAA